jgi:hypothetical protein
VLSCSRAYIAKKRGTLFFFDTLWYASISFGAQGGVQEMMPHVSLNPDVSQLDPGIVPLVQVINGFGLPTFYSCEGHGRQATGSFRSPFPMVVIFPEPNPDGACRMLRLMGMIGIHNGDVQDHESIRWVLMPEEDGGFMLRPLSRHTSPRIYRQGITALVSRLQEMDTWYRWVED